jgi:F-type H+-transporting ATPase subunit alpha
MAVEDQVMVIYAVTQGFLDDVDVNHILGWEKSFLEYVRAAHPGIGAAIRDEGVLSEETEKGLRKAIEEHKRIFRTEAAQQVAAAGV